MGEKEISLVDMIAIIRKRLKFIILLALLGALLAFGISSIIPKQYETFTTLLIGRPEGYQSGNDFNVNELYFNQQLVGTYSELIQSRTVADQVQSNLGLNMSYDEFRDKMEVTAVNDTEVIQIEVRDEHPVRAKDIANETASIFSSMAENAMKIDNVQVVDFAAEPEEPVSPRVLLNTILGGLAGLVLGLVLAAFREVTDNRVKDASDIEGIGLTVLGSIPVLEKETK